MNAIRFLGVFLVVAVMTTVVVIACAFMVWSVLLPAQPGTATALATLFLVSPSIGIVAGLVAAGQSVRRRGSSAPLMCHRGIF